MTTFDCTIPRIVKVHDILRDKKKPYLRFSHCLIMKGDDLTGPPTEVLQKDLTFANLGNNENPLKLSEKEAELTLSKLK